MTDVKGGLTPGVIEKYAAATADTDHAACVALTDPVVVIVPVPVSVPSGHVSFG